MSFVGGRQQALLDFCIIVYFEWPSNNSNIIAVTQDSRVNGQVEQIPQALLRLVPRLYIPKSTITVITLCHCILYCHAPLVGDCHKGQQEQ